MGLAYQGAFMFYTMVAGQVGIINEDIGEWHGPETGVVV